MFGSPSAMRRLVAGPDSSGKTRILSDGASPRCLTHDGNGTEMADMWTTDAAPPIVTGDAGEATLDPHVYFPAPGGTHFMINRMASMAERRRRAAAGDPREAGAAFLQGNPGMADVFEEGGNGMHTSSTIDYGLVLAGAIDLELDDGVITRMTAGDSYVLKAARHRWIPLEDSDCTIAVVLIGAEVPAQLP